MRVDGAFEVPVDVEEAWATLLDVERVAPCLPGARLESSDAEGRYTGSMRVKLGPVTSAFQGTVHIADADASARRVVLQAAARDTRGQGAATATITSTLTPAGDGTRVAVETDLKLAGTAAQFGRGVVHDVTRRLLDEFGERLAAEIERPAVRAMPTMGASEGDPGRPVPSDATPRAAPPPSAPDDVFDATAAGRAALRERALPAAAAIAAALALLALVSRGRKGGRPIVVKGPLVVIGGGARRRRRR